MSDKERDQIMEVHLKGAFACTKAAWPIFRKQKFGRIVNVASAAGLYGEPLFWSYSRFLIAWNKATLVKQTTAPQRWVSLDLPRLLPEKVLNTVSRRPSSARLRL